MITAQDIYRQIKDLVSYLIEHSLCNDQKFPCMTQSGTITEISFSGANSLSVVLKNIAYRDIYSELLRTQTYSVKMIDGALLQFMYRFDGDELSAHRLAFFPSPDLSEFQNNPDIYELDEIYADIINKNIVAFPIRFDFDKNEEIFVDIHHPKSHVTLGQYKNCRIPASGPITPRSFVDFILRSFYNTAHRKFCVSLPVFEELFTNTITDNECKVIHIAMT